MSEKKKSNWSKPELNKLRKSLPSNWKDELSTAHSLAAGTIENILYGSQVNDDVILSAIELAENHKQLIQSKKQIIKTL